jgi:hypothetical protein
MADKDVLANPDNVKFMDLLHICIKNFGKPRIRGSHHIFKTPWQGDPRINIQKDGNMAKPYQVKMILTALDKLNELKKQEEEKEKSKDGKKSESEGEHGKE